VICEDACLLVHAYEDGELDLAKSLEVETHVRTCNACAHEQAGLRELRNAFSHSNLHYNAPAKLQRRVRTALRDARRAEYGHGFALSYLGWAGAAAVGALVIAIIAGKLLLAPPTSELTVREVVDDHLRSLMQNHLADVLSSNKHTVKPWFDGKLDFTPPVVDLGGEGFPLVGGRIDYLDNRPVAALVYRRREHIINVFIVPAPRTNDSPAVSEVRAGYNVVDWTRSGMKYWAVSSLSAPELGKFAQLLRNESSAASTPSS
jgi:anti-sigma factor RsiW